MNGNGEMSGLDKAMEIKLRTLSVVEERMVEKVCSVKADAPLQDLVYADVR